MKNLSKSFENCKIMVVMLSVFLLSSILGPQTKAGWVEPDATKIYYLGNKVGIGTTMPGASFHVYDGQSSLSVNNEVAVFSNAGSDGGYSYVVGPVLVVTTDGNGTIRSSYANNALVKFGIGGGNTGSVVTEYFRINGNGKVGIGTPNPGSKLDVNGQINADGASGIGFNNNANGFGMTLNENDLRLTTYEDLHFRTYTEGSYNEKVTILQNGNVGIGTMNPGDARLAVRGKIKATEVVVLADIPANWPDHVFKADYNLMKLDELENNIKENGHLPEIPSASEVAKDGVNVGEMQAKLLQKIEELTLYVIGLKKENNELKSRISSLEIK